MSYKFNPFTGNLDKVETTEVNLSDGTTNGEMLYWDGATWVPASEVYWDETNTKMGIGTTSPHEKLHLWGGTAKLYDGGNMGDIPLNIGGNLRLERAEVSLAGVGHNNSDSQYGNSGNYYLKARNNSSWQDVCQFSYGGLGLTSTLTAKDIHMYKSDSTGDWAIVYGNKGSGSAKYEFRTRSYSRLFRWEGAHTNSSPSWSSPYMVIENPTGYVGINNTDPNYHLDVNGGIAFRQQSTPADPPEGSSVMWMDSTTGDMMVKITFGGVTKTATLADFSTL